MAIKQFSVYNLGIGNLLNDISDQAIESTKVVAINAASVYNVPGIRSKITVDWGGVLKANYVQETVAAIITKFAS